MIYECYLWLMETLFATENLPEILQPISQELCAIFSIVIVIFIIAAPLYMLYRLCRFMFEVHF